MRVEQRGTWRKWIVRCVVGFAIVQGLRPGGYSLLRADIPRTGCYKRDSLDPKIEAAIDEFSAGVPLAMKSGGVSGAAIALVDDAGILWTEGFGYAQGKSKPVTPDTRFLVCGISKLITATAVMIAVQDRVVDLDEPITRYLKDFKLHSRYESHPEEKVTLRNLLNYTAGMPVEATVGNYFEPCSQTSFEDHVKSLFKIWLVYPVGRSYYHSGASSDLAAYAVQVGSGMSFEQYLKEKIFTPVGMTNSTADRREILQSTERAIGGMMGMSKVPAVYPATGAGGVYSTARDLARFVQLHLNQGTVDGRRIVDRVLMKRIQSPVGIISTDPNVYYGMGITIDKRAPDRKNVVLWQDGQGFGFQSMIYWYPEYGLGAVVVTNRWPNSAMEGLSFGLTDRLIQQKIVEKHYPTPTFDLRSCIGAWWGWPEHQPSPFKNEWRQYLGTYRLCFNEYSLEWWAYLAVLLRDRDEYTPRITIVQKDGHMCVTESKFFESLTGGFRSIDESLQEISPGVFSTKGGNVLDLSCRPPTWCNYRLRK